MNENNKYGYNLCYIEKGHKRKHRYITTNTYGLAEFEKRLDDLPAKKIS